MMKLNMNSGWFSVLALLLLLIIHPSSQQETKINNVESLFRQRRKVIQVDSLNPRRSQHETVNMYHDVESRPIRLRKVNAEMTTTMTKSSSAHNQFTTEKIASGFVVDRLLEDLFAPASSMSFSFSLSMSM
jgi:hypothetical protein